MRLNKNLPQGKAISFTRCYLEIVIFALLNEERFSPIVSKTEKEVLLTASALETMVCIFAVKSVLMLTGEELNKDK